MPQDVYGKGRGMNGKGGNNPNVGAAWVSDGECSYYVGLDGDKMIGVGHQYKASRANMPNRADCVIAGEIRWFMDC